MHAISINSFLKPVAVSNRNLFPMDIGYSSFNNYWLIQRSQAPFEGDRLSVWNMRLQESQLPYYDYSIVIWELRG